MKLNFLVFILLYWQALAQIQWSKKWDLTINEGTTKSSPAIDLDGTIYIGTTKRLLAVDSKTGGKKWEFEAGYPYINHTPVLGVDECFYLPIVGKKIYAINRITRAKKWEHSTIGEMYSAPAVGKNGTVYIGTDAGYMFGLDSNSGEELMRFKATDGIFSSPAIANDGTVYVASENNLHAVNGLTGKEKWSFKTDVFNSFQSSEIAVDFDGSVYIGTTDYNTIQNKIYAIRGESGLKKWESTVEGTVNASPVIGPGGIIYIGTRQGLLYALDANTGEKIWTFSTGGIVSAAVVGVNGTVYVGSTDSKIYAIDGNSGVKKWEFITSGDIKSSPALGDNGLLVFASHDKLYSIQTDSMGLADSSWPMYQSSRSHSGQVERKATDVLWAIDDLKLVGTSPLDTPTGDLIVGGNKIACINTETAEIKWTVDAPQNIRFVRPEVFDEEKRVIGIGFGGNFDENSYLIVINPPYQPQDIKITQLSSSAEYRPEILRGIGVGNVILTCADGTGVYDLSAGFKWKEKGIRWPRKNTVVPYKDYFVAFAQLAGEPADTLKAFSYRDGSILWSSEDRVYGGQLIYNGGNEVIVDSGRNLVFVDVRSGKTVSGYSPGYSFL